MHNEDYIASGILELYAAGALTRQEMEEVEEMAAASPEVRAALDEACAAMEAYAQLHAVQPKPDLKEKILGVIPAEEPEPITEPEPIINNRTESVTGLPFYPAPVPDSGSTSYKWMLAASVTLFLISGLLSIYFYNKWQQAEQQLVRAKASEQLFAQKSSNVLQRLEQQERMLNILKQPACRAIVLTGKEANPNANVMVYWNTEKQEVHLEVLQLPAPPSGKQYQLWALNNGKPTDAGVLDRQLQAYTLQQMEDVRAAQAFAITLEPSGGSEAPTLEQLYVMGEVKS